MLLFCVGCDMSSEQNPPEATTTVTTKTSNYKNDPINQWTPLTVSGEMEEDLYRANGETIDFKPLGYIEFGHDFKLISSAEQVDSIKDHAYYGYNWYEYPFALKQVEDKTSAETQEKILSDLRKVDFETYYVLVCPAKYSSSDFGFEGEPLIRLIKRDDKLRCVFQSDWAGEDFTNDIRYISALALVKKADWTLGEDISTADVCIYNKNHKTVSAVYQKSFAIPNYNSYLSWNPFTLSDNIKKDLSEIEGEVIEFTPIAYIQDGHDFKLISNVLQIEILKDYGYNGYGWHEAPLFHSDMFSRYTATQTRDEILSKLKYVDFENYYLLVCPVNYSSSDLGYAGEPLLQLMNRDNKLYCVFQSDYWGNGFDTDIRYISALVMVKKADCKFGEDVSSAEVAIYNQRNKDVGGVYHRKVDAAMLPENYKNHPINEWTPYTLPTVLQEEFSDVQGEVIEFKTLGYISNSTKSGVVSSPRGLYTLGLPWEEYTGAGEYLNASNNKPWTELVAELRNIDFEEYYVLVCPIRYAPNEFGFEGEPMLRLIKRDNELYCVFQSDWNGEDYNLGLSDVEYVNAVVLVKKSDWTLGEKVYNPSILIYNKNNKDIGSYYNPDASVFK